ncbi:type II toxin-antitoxin system VapC family toxin [Candidatus Woesebacteria bacterium]|nr:type II toxin-antitoxin system VapC family toxin [Candidatus Woesebacteria bacterium]
MPDEDISKLLSSLVEGHVLSQIRLIAPKLLPFEVANTLRVGIIRRRISLSTAKELISEFLDLNISLLDIDYKKAIILADKYNISVYDASYVELAKSRGTKLVSLDKELVDLV